MIFQDPMTSLNPLMTIERQIREVLEKRVGMRRSASRARAVELLDLVGIPFPKERLKQYPLRVLGRDAPAGDDRHRARRPSPCS